MFVSVGHVIGDWVYESMESRLSTRQRASMTGYQRVAVYATLSLRERDRFHEIVRTVSPEPCPQNRVCL
jgi:hypothetical protein